MLNRFSKKKEDMKLNFLLPHFRYTWIAKLFSGLNRLSGVNIKEN